MQRWAGVVVSSLCVPLLGARERPLLGARERLSVGVALWGKQPALQTRPGGHSFTTSPSALFDCYFAPLTQGGEDMDMDDAPPEPQGPVVDEDGFQVVQRKGRGRR